MTDLEDFAGRAVASTRNSQPKLTKPMVRFASVDEKVAIATDKLTSNRVDAEKRIDARESNS